MIEAAKLEADIYPAGPRGLSAYEIYKKEGGQLSEEEWLKSLNGLTPTIGENGNWFLGTVDTGLPSRGPKGDTGSIKFIVVTELPTENIDETAIYLKPVESPTGENKFEELIYVNGKWEDLGTPNVAVDLSNYYTKTEVKQITGELTNLNTEDKSNLVNAINEVMNSCEDSSIPVVDIGNNSMISSNYIFSGSDERLQIVEAMRKATEDGTKKGTILIIATDELSLMMIKLSGKTNNRPNYSFLGYGSKRYKYSDSRVFFYDGNIILNDDFTFYSATRSNGVYICEKDDVLTKTNTTSYTPTGDYNPATKKYVDDQVGNINTVLATLTTVSEVTK